MTRRWHSKCAGFLLPLFLVALPGSVAQAGNALPELRVIDHAERYVVTGDTARSIRAQLESRSGAGEKSRHGATRSTVEVISKLEEMDGSCRVLQQEIVVEITTVLPQWEPRRKVGAALRAEWEESFERLVRHEAGHRQNVLQATADLREKLASLQPHSRCLTTRAGIDIALENALNRLDRREVYYDRLTRDGQRDLPQEGDSSRTGNAKDTDASMRLPASRGTPVEALPME